MNGSPFPADYAERVYAGVLGKIIGVYLGRPFEGWTYERILRDLGEITGYVNDRLPHRPPLVVTDDDIGGTFTFLRALEDYGASPELSAAQIGQTWLNYLIERKTILWWGGMGNSTEHTAYARLRQGIPAPWSGSAALNGKVVAEQIGAQIFVDGWGMVAPGQPALAARLARKAASVSHDGEAIHAAVVVAAMEAQAFVERDMDALFEAGLSQISPDCLVARLIGDVRRWCVQDEDWHATLARIAAEYGYDKYGGNCHVIPNHAVIAMALAYAQGDFARGLRIANTAGWDTDCNSGNVGCLLGIAGGLEGIAGGETDWRGPVADRLYLSSADGGRAISDALQESGRIVALAHALAGAEYEPPKGGARFHFSMPGSVQGFGVLDGQRMSTDQRITPQPSHGSVGDMEKAGDGGVRIENKSAGALHIHHGGEARVATPTFIPPEAFDMPGYALVASPTLYAGQRVRADVRSDVAATVRLFARAYGADDRLVAIESEETCVPAGETCQLAWTLPDEGGSPIAEIGVAVRSETAGTLALESLTWEGAPTVALRAPEHNGTRWQRAWVPACDDAQFPQNQGMRVMHEEGTGLLIQGEREWRDYAVRATIVPHLAKAAGIAACVQGTRRYYALMLCDDRKARLLKALDGEHVLAACEFAWVVDAVYELRLEARGERLIATIDGQTLFDVRDGERPLREGAVALVISDGRLDCAAVEVRAVSRPAT